MAVTARGFRYPLGSDSPNVPQDLQNLANDIDAMESRIATRSVLEVGQVGQTRAGRQLALADFTAMGLNAPNGLFNFNSSILDQSGNGYDVGDRGGVGFAIGIEGVANSAAQFTGGDKALYRVDAGAGDPYRLRTGTFGSWFKTPKQGVDQVILSKDAAGGRSYVLYVTAGNTLAMLGSVDGSVVSQAFGQTNVADDKWHFGVGSFDGSVLRTYVDGVLEGVAELPGLLYAGASTGPFNIGAYRTSGASAALLPFFGRLDETFVTQDVLTEDQIRMLMSIKIPHGMSTRTPRRAGLAVRRRVRGPLLSTTDFPAAPTWLLNLDNATTPLKDAGSASVMTVNAGTGIIDASVAPGPNGLRQSAMFFSGAHTGLSASDAGLPAALAARSFGGWVKSASPSSQAVMGWGNNGTLAIALLTIGGGNVYGYNVSAAFNGIDGLFHHYVLVEDNAAADGLKCKLYIDGALAASTTTAPNSVSLAGAGAFRVGAQPNGSNPFSGSLSRMFVYPGALTADQIAVAYNKATLPLPISPKNSGDHVEGIDAANVYFLGDRLDATAQVDLEVAA